MAKNPFQANRIHAYLEIFFTWCWDRSYCEPSPMAGLEKQYAERSRDRTLSTDELRALWAGCLELGYPWGELVRFTLATGQRPGECRRLRRDDLHNGVWLVEGGDPKNRERHRIPLPRIARQIVKAAPKHAEGPYVFSTTAGKLPVGQGGKPYAALKAAAGFEGWQPRDLRRTFSTLASEELDIDPHMIGAIANQKSVSKPGVAGVYNRSTWIKQKGVALEAWNQYLTRIVRKKS
jgi:integrase